MFSTPFTRQYVNLKFHYRIWLYNNERLLHIAFYTFTSLIRDHEPRLENLRAKEIKFCRIIFDAHVCINFHIFYLR